MAVPARRTSKTTKRLRRTHYKLKARGVAVCSHCGALVHAHTVCKKCGYYDGKQVVQVKEKESK